MSEESERVGSGTEGNGAGVDPTAVALALAGASREDADAFLREQRAIASDQRRHLHEQFKQLRPKLWEVHLGRAAPDFARLRSMLDLAERYGSLIDLSSHRMLTAGEAMKIAPQPVDRARVTLFCRASEEEYNRYLLGTQR